MDDVRVCIVDECTAPPSEELLVNDGGIVLAYAMCGTHLLAARQGAWLAIGTVPFRGLLGMSIRQSV